MHNNIIIMAFFSEVTKQFMNGWEALIKASDIDENVVQVHNLDLCIIVSFFCLLI